LQEGRLSNPAQRWRGHFFVRLRTEQFGAAEDQPVEAEEGAAELCCGAVGVAGWAEGEAVEEEYGFSVGVCCSMTVWMHEETADILISMIPNNAITISFEDMRSVFFQQEFNQEIYADCR
jgi:hypothetical protein